MYFEKLLKLSDAELDAKNYDKVKELLSIATPMYPEEEGIIIRNKFIAQKTKDTNLAKSLIKEAQVLKTNKEYKKAIQKMEKAIEADPFYSNGYYIKAMIYKEMGENKLAIKFFNGYLELVPKASNVSEIKNTIKKLESTK
jgi:tetratricopeptide (TPR) repeat protein